MSEKKRVQKNNQKEEELQNLSEISKLKEIDMEEFQVRNFIGISLKFQERMAIEGIESEAELNKRIIDLMVKLKKMDPEIQDEVQLERYYRDIYAIDSARLHAFEHSGFGIERGTEKREEKNQILEKRERRKRKSENKEKRRTRTESKIFKLKTRKNTRKWRKKRD